MLDDSVPTTTAITTVVTAYVPRWYAEVVLTEAEAAELRRMLDDPALRAHEGVRVPLMDPEAVARWRERRVVAS